MQEKEKNKQQKIEINDGFLCHTPILITMFAYSVWKEELEDKNECWIVICILANCDGFRFATVLSDCTFDWFWSDNDCILAGGTWPNS